MKMKKIMALLTVGAMLTGVLTGCGGNEGSSQGGSSQAGGDAQKENSGGEEAGGDEAGGGESGNYYSIITFDHSLITTGDDIKFVMRWDDDGDNDGMRPVSLSGGGSTYTFPMPAYDVTVRAKFTKI